MRTSILFRRFLIIAREKIVILNKIFLRVRSFFILQSFAPKSCPLETILKEIKEAFISLFLLYDDISYLLLISLV